jgi:predicted nucleic acid-binding Zn ribbon protein
MSHHEHEALHLEQQHLRLDDKSALNPEQRCDRCGAPFSPRRSSGGSQQRFCSSDCRMTFHKERQRTQRRASYAGPTSSPATAQPAANEEAGEAGGRLVLMGQRDFIEVARDQHGNLVLRQSRDYDGDHELRVCRDCFPRFLEALDALRELIAEAIRKDETL